MAPTINGVNDGAGGSEKRPPKPTERKSDLITRIKYSNTLPDVPFDLKYLMYPFENDRFMQYNPTSLERNYKYEVLCEHDLGVTINLINKEMYQPDAFSQLAPADEKLLEEDVHAPQDSNRSRQHSRAVSWLRKSEYISTEQTRFQPQNIEKIEAKVGFNVKRSFREETLYLDRDAQIKAIEKTFDDTKFDITKHYSKPNVVPVEVLPIYPDFKNWKYPCAQVIFDNDPAPIGKNVATQLEEMSQAMIRGVMDESGEQFVAYFLPTEQTLEKRRRDVSKNVLYEDDEDYEYKIAREYNWNVKSKASKGYEENYFFVVNNDGVYYNELETRVRLSKRRVKFGQQPSNTKLIVKHRSLNANEHRLQRYRERHLEAAGDEEDEEMEVVEKVDEKASGKIKEVKDNETKDAEVTTETRKSRSRSRSVPKEKSRSRSASLSKRSRSSKSPPKRRSSNNSGSRSKSASHSKSRSPSRSNSVSSGSKSISTSRSGSRSSSRSRSQSGSHSSRSQSGSSRSRSNSKDKHSKPTKSRSRSNGSRSSVSGSLASNRSDSESRSRSISRSGSPSGSGSGSESAEGN